MLARRAIRVRRYLPAKLSAPDIAGVPCLPVNTTRTRMRHLYDKRGAHRRHEAVEQVGALGLLASSPFEGPGQREPRGTLVVPSGQPGRYLRPPLAIAPPSLAPNPPAAASRVAGASHPAV
jgi:hypothetical protein